MYGPPRRRVGLRAGRRRWSWVLATVGAVAIVGALFMIEPNVSLPSQLWIASPYLVTIVALAGLSRRGGTPAYLGIPWSAGEDEV